MLEPRQHSARVSVREYYLYHELLPYRQKKRNLGNGVRCLPPPHSLYCTGAVIYAFLMLKETSPRLLSSGATEKMYRYIFSKPNRRRCTTYSGTQKSCSTRSVVSWRYCLVARIFGEVQVGCSRLRARKHVLVGSRYRR